MAVAQPQPMSVVQRHSSPSGLADVLDVILDKGIVIDVFVRVALVGIELLTIDARIVIASVDTYLHFAEAVNRLDLTQVGSQQTLPEMVSDMTSSGASGKTRGMLEGAKDALFGGGDDEEDEEETSSSSRRSSGDPEPRPRRTSRDPESRPRRTSSDSESRPRRTSSGSRPRGR
ncbi:MAG TPA: gas vesicle protein GvpJ [Solirubrobacteraceae bacterium]|nr:gas vesicle protein GvpJ [Solirubrobacteraceae bacterium]